MTALFPAEAQSLRAYPLPLGGAVAQRLRGFKSAEPEKTVKRSSRRTGDTAAALAAAGWNLFDTLQNNDAYHALQAVEGLIITGATGTNVNDVAVVLIGGEEQADA